MEDLRPYIADASLTNPDFDMADFSKPSMAVATGEDGKINVLPPNQDLFILKIMKECGPPGNVGFNWNECQTTFMQGRAAMWWDGIGFSAPLLDKTKSKIVDKVGLAPRRTEIPQLRHLHRRHWHSRDRRGQEQEGRLAVPAMDLRQRRASRGPAHRIGHSRSAFRLCSRRPGCEQQFPEGMVRHDGDQPEDRAFGSAGYRSGHGVSRHDRRGLDKHRGRGRSGDGIEEGHDRVSARLGQV